MNLVYTIIFSLGICLTIFGKFEMQSGCYKKSNIKFGNCDKFINVDVMILNKIDNSKIHYIDNKIKGSYIYHNNTYECEVIGIKPKSNKTYDLYTIPKPNKLTKCYTKSSVDFKGLFGFFCLFTGIMFMIISAGSLIYNTMTKYLENKENKRTSDLIEIQLNNAFGMTDTRGTYTILNNDDIMNEDSINKL